MSLGIIGGDGYEKGQWRWELWSMTFGKWRLVYTDGVGAADFYCMRNLELGVKAYRDMIIDGKRPESGWTRCFVDGEFHYPEETATDCSKEVT